MKPTVLVVPILFVAACTTPPPPSPPTIAQQADSIARIFETPVAYAPRVLDSATVLAFAGRHPGDSAAISDFYRRRGFHYAWFIGDSVGSAARNVLNLFPASDTAGGISSVPGRTGLQRLLMRMDTLQFTDSLRAATELALTAGFFQAANAKYGGIIQRDPRELEWYIPRKKKNYDRLLDSLVAGVNDLTPIEPLSPQYTRLKNALKFYASLDTLPWPTIAWKKGRTPGDSLLALLRSRLVLLGDLPTVADSLIGDSLFAAGVMSAQHRFGLKETGEPDPDLLAELNVPPADRQRQILLNMERQRWLPARPDSNGIMVNIPAYRMLVYEEGHIAWTMNVVVGADASRTVMFSGDLSQVVMAPYWNIPQSIIRSEILPAVKRNPGYLARKNMEVVMGGQVVPASSIDWKKYTKGVPFTIRQKPGPGNALGRVKFLFPNSYSIYFHDTPAKDKFLRDQRAFSHGCVRLSEPLRLAKYLLRNDSAWTPERINTAMNAKTETTVRLKKPVPVVLGYFTAWVDRDGIVSFRRDVYGHDARLAAELFAGEGGAQASVR